MYVFLSFLLRLFLSNFLHSGLPFPVFRSHTCFLYPFPSSYILYIQLLIFHNHLYLFFIFPHSCTCSRSSLCCLKWFNVGVNNGVPTTIPTLDEYNQVWLIDLSSAADDSPTHMELYSRVSTWFNNRKETEGRVPATILDGRILSSLWSTSAGVTIDGCEPWTQNQYRPNG